LHWHLLNTVYACCGAAEQQQQQQQLFYTTAVMTSTFINYGCCSWAIALLWWSWAHINECNEWYDNQIKIDLTEHYDHSNDCRAWVLPPKGA
jgi:hypothetical protein